MVKYINVTIETTEHQTVAVCNPNKYINISITSAIITIHKHRIALNGNTKFLKAIAFVDNPIYRAFNPDKINPKIDIITDDNVISHATNVPRLSIILFLPFFGF